MYRIYSASFESFLLSTCFLSDISFMHSFLTVWVIFLPATAHSPICWYPEVISSVPAVQSGQRPRLLPGQVQRRRSKRQHRNISLRHPAQSLRLGRSRAESLCLQRQSRSTSVTVCLTWTVSETREKTGSAGQRRLHDDYGKYPPPQPSSITFTLSLLLSFSLSTF